MGILIFLVFIQYEIQWDSIVRLTNAEGSSMGVISGVDDSGGVHVVWDDNRDRPDTTQTFPVEVYYKHSLDSGLTWSADTPLTPLDDSASSYGYAMCVKNYSIHLTLGSIYYVRSGDRGRRWDIVIDQDLGFLSSPHGIAVDDSGGLHFVLGEGGVLYYGRSYDGGLSWYVDSVSWDGVSMNRIVVDRDFGVHIVHGGWGAGLWHLYSPDRGRTWFSENQIVAGDAYFPDYPDLAIDKKGTLYLVFNGAGYTSWYRSSIWFTKSEDGGFTWTQPYLLDTTIFIDSFHRWTPGYPTVGVDSFDGVYVGWEKWLSGGGIPPPPPDSLYIMFGYSFNGGNSFIVKPFIFGDYLEIFPEISVSKDGAIHFFWVRGIRGTSGYLDIDQTDIYYLRGRRVTSVKEEIYFLNRKFIFNNIVRDYLIIKNFNKKQIILFDVTGRKYRIYGEEGRFNLKGLRRGKYFIKGFKSLILKF